MLRCVTDVFLCNVIDFFMSVRSASRNNKLHLGLLDKCYLIEAIVFMTGRFSLMRL